MRWFANFLVVLFPPIPFDYDDDEGYEPCDTDTCAGNGTL